MPNVYIKDLDTHEVIHTMKIEGSRARADKVIDGLYMRMNLDKFYLDSDELDKYHEEKELATRRPL